MSIAFSQGKLKSQERQAILESIQTQLQQIILEGVTLVLEEFLEQEVTAKLGRVKRSARRVSSQPRVIDWQCVGCGCRDANQFTREGHYRRSLETGWGHLETLRVPMLECQCCQHDVVAHFAGRGKSTGASGWMPPITPSLAVGYARVYASSVNNGQPCWAQVEGCERSMNE